MYFLHDMCKNKQLSILFFMIIIENSLKRVSEKSEKL